MNFSKSYPSDIIFFLIAIPIISAFNYHLTYNNIEFNGFLILTYTIDTIQGYIAWLCVRWMIIKLDHIYPFSKHISRRLLIQIISTTAVGLLIIIVLTEIVSWSFKGRPALSNFYTTDIFIISVWFLVINAFYIILHFYQEWKKSLDSPNAISNTQTEYLIISLARKKIKIPFQELDLVYLRDGVTELYMREKVVKCFLTIRSLENQLPTSEFFRVNRQFILSRKSVKEYRKIENGKIKVLLSARSLDFGDIIISRTRAPIFKRWMTGN